MSETIAAILNAHRTGRRTPAATIAQAYDRIRAYGDDAVFISLRAEADAVAEAERLSPGRAADRPLFGVPFAVKDNINVAGLPTTAACPAFAFRPAHDATAVARLRAAGAIPIGKTNLDQFATGLVGVRSPYGIPRNPFDRAVIPGGSSSGSAVAVAAGLVPIALGTDTAGSGRVPAGFNNVVGLKPSLGLVSTHGLVPACRTLDCVSVFALTVEDAYLALEVLAGFDAADPFSRGAPIAPLGAIPQGLRLGVPADGQRIFYGDRIAASAYDAALARLARLGATIIDIDMEPFYETARLLYDGPWVAERYITARDLIASSPGSLHPVTREIILSGARPTAVDAFAAFYKLAELRRVRDRTFSGIDALVLPTTPTVYTVAQVLSDPIALNSRLGTYTNFVNLLELCAIAVPAAMRPDGIPFGITLLAKAGQDSAVAAIARAFHADTGLPLGASQQPHPPLTSPLPPTAGEIPLAVVGAHLSGMPLNGELQALGARLLEQTTTAPEYRLYALEGTRPAKPGLLRVDGQGSAIAVEVWALPPEAFGRFVNAVPPPLSIGTLRLHDGRSVKGFLVEPIAVASAPDISDHGGWRAYMASLAGTA